MVLATIAGVIGLILITAGVLFSGKIIRITRRFRTSLEDLLFVLGGLFLVTYSISIKNVIFTILQIVFVAASLYEMMKSSRKK